MKSQGIDSSQFQRGFWSSTRLKYSFFSIPDVSWNYMQQYEPNHSSNQRFATGSANDAKNGLKRIGNLCKNYHHVLRKASQNRKPGLLDN
jgi:hypothetical protein